MSRYNLVKRLNVPEDRKGSKNCRMLLLSFSVSLSHRHTQKAYANITFSFHSKWLTFLSHIMIFSYDWSNKILLSYGDVSTFLKPSCHACLVKQNYKMDFSLILSMKYDTPLHISKLIILENICPIVHYTHSLVSTDPFQKCCLPYISCTSQELAHN